MEQLLLSTAVDRALEDFPDEPFKGKSVHVEAKNLDCTDKAYVTQCLRAVVLDTGATLAKDAASADIILEAASGAVAMNRREFLLGLPALPLPIPYAGETLKFPEVPLWKLVTYRGRAKMLLCAVDPKTGSQVADLPMRYGKSRDSFWWLLVVGPVRSTDLPEASR